ncbi:glycosyltransferase [Microbacterium sp. EYE_5]|uniref:glycosyltransferase n=1 Tax=unclassified Microbacterium TaxID=2609290 RepID=UPI002002D883|nr:MULTISPECIES: glycosyltransferase [unclassified Microbacterium]MCK6079293.1 glycosyltransferase [Microbacterium sp. EYE_382]MCK6084563.1 glycosyltransferase [Microbacterium sp. EYE_384]MCK6123208.1 glycosyltransferase [Microbacterium sp. EYE_80]MCK6125327.1 glycosyltransferase [Microbacterium sp. EYE_79]MCK6140247.1 glycosyltransferase [Microbacterium sp. EYE_39]
MRSETPRIGYVVKVYPRFSETFVVTEILAREARGEDLAVFALRPTDDTRFHPELARVQAPVFHLARPAKPSALWAAIQDAAADPVLGRAIARHLGDLLAADVDDAVQAILLAAAARREGITHLHAHFASVATTVARLASRLTGIPYSFTAHAKDLFHEAVDHADLSRKFADSAFAVTVSDFNLDFVRGTIPGGERTHRLYNGLELDRFPFVPRPARRGPLRIAAVGRLVEKKGFAVLVEAVAKLTADGIDVTVDLAGTGELRDQLAAQIDAAGLTDSVALLGPLPQHDLARLLAASDVFAAPCVVSADGNADGLPTVLLEAMATGIPCISTDVTGIPEIVRDGETGVLCRAGSVDDLVSALRGIADGTTDAAALAARARLLVEERFDSRRQAAELARLTAEAARPRLLEEVA